MIEHRKIALLLFYFNHLFLVCIYFFFFTGCYMLFGECYLQKVKDSWRVVNHRDIIPTVPRLMGYCHVAQPVYLAAGDLRNALVGNLFFSFIWRSNLYLHIKNNKAYTNLLDIIIFAFLYRTHIHILFVLFTCWFSNLNIDYKIDMALETVCHFAVLSRLF